MPLSLRKIAAFNEKILSQAMTEGRIPFLDGEDIFAPSAFDLRWSRVYDANPGFLREDTLINLDVEVSAAVRKEPAFRNRLVCPDGMLNLIDGALQKLGFDRFIKKIMLVETVLSEHGVNDIVQVLAPLVVKTTIKGEREAVSNGQVSAPDFSSLQTVLS